MNFSFVSYFNWHLTISSETVLRFFLLKSKCHPRTSPFLPSTRGFPTPVACGPRPGAVVCTVLKGEVERIRLSTHLDEGGVRSYVPENGKKLRPRHTENHRRTRGEGAASVQERRGGPVAALRARRCARGRATLPAAFTGWRRRERAGPGARRPPLLRPETIVEEP